MSALLTVQEFNQNVSSMIAIDSNRNAVLDDGDTIVASKDIAIYKRGDVVPFNDAYFTAICGEIVEELEVGYTNNVIGATELESKNIERVAEMYGLKVQKTPVRYRGLFAQIALTTPTGSTIWLMRLGNSAGQAQPDEIFMPGAFTTSFLSYSISHYLHVDNKIPSENTHIQQTTQAKQILTSHGYTIQNGAIVNTKTQERVIGLEGGENSFMDVNRAVYFGTDQAGNLICTLIEKDGDQLYFRFNFASQDQTITHVKLNGAPEGAEFK